MKKMTFALVGAAALALAACGGKQEENTANTEENMGMENLEAAANEAANAEADALANQADSLNTAADTTAPADEADANAAAVNAM
jgi:hypothetical protein